MVDGGQRPQLHEQELRARQPINLTSTIMTNTQTQALCHSGSPTRAQALVGVRVARRVGAHRSRRLASKHSGRTEVGYIEPSKKASGCPIRALCTLTGPSWVARFDVTTRLGRPRARVLRIVGGPKRIVCICHHGSGRLEPLLPRVTRQAPAGVAEVSVGFEDEREHFVRRGGASSSHYNT